MFLHLKYLVWEPRFLSMASREPMPRYFFSRIPSEKKYSPGASLVAASREPIITEIRVSQGGELEAGLEWITESNHKYSRDYPNLWMRPVPELWRCGQQSGCRRRRWRARRTSWRTPIPCRPLWPGVGRMPALVGARKGSESVWITKIFTDENVCHLSCWFLNQHHDCWLDAFISLSPATHLKLRH